MGMVWYGDLLRAFAELKPETKEEEDKIAGFLGFERKIEDAEETKEDEKTENVK